MCDRPPEDLSLRDCLPDCEELLELAASIGGLELIVSVE